LREKAGPRTRIGLEARGLVGKNQGGVGRIAETYGRSQKGLVCRRWNSRATTGNSRAGVVMNARGIIEGKGRWKTYERDFFTRLREEKVRIYDSYRRVRNAHNIDLNKN